MNMAVINCCCLRCEAIQKSSSSPSLILQIAGIHTLNNQGRKRKKIHVRTAEIR